MHEVVEPETRCAFLGQTLELPLLAAPIGGVAFSVAAVGGFDDGVSQYIQQMAGQLKAAMVLTGTARVDAVERSILRL